MPIIHLLNLDWLSKWVLVTKQRITAGSGTFGEIDNMVGKLKS